MVALTNASDVTVVVSIDTEEDDWAHYVERGASTRNIAHLRELQEHFEAVGARPTYLVNYPPLVDAASVDVLGDIADKEWVEIGAHCHPWNTPPFSGRGENKTMMCNLTAEENEAKLRILGDRLQGELGVVPKVFRAGRWGFGPTVAAPLVDLGYEVDCSVSPFVDWSRYGGPDYTSAPHRPYRFDPYDPIRSDPKGRLAELPATVGFLRGRQRDAARMRAWMERSLLAKIRLVGVLDRAGLLTRRWLSPENSDGDVLVQLAEAWVAGGERFLQLTFHSCALLPGATPFVRDRRERQRLLGALDQFLRYCAESGFRFSTLAEAKERVAPSAVD